MVRARTQIINERAESLTATLQVLGTDFHFDLYSRPVILGAYGTIKYYWMDSSQFRNIKSDESAKNFRAVIGYWANAMRASGALSDPDQEIHYVLAVCYGLQGRSKGLQSIYRDAYLALETNLAEADSLPDEVRLRIKNVLDSRDRNLLAREMNDALGAFLPLPGKLPGYQEALRQWMGRAVTLFREKGNAGIEVFLEEIDYWIRRYKKDGSNSDACDFVNIFAYECKAAFYTCYANAWASLIPWLKEHRSLDLVSERFLRMWHMQNARIEIPHGRTSGGIHYPTSKRVVLRSPSSSSKPSLQVVDAPLARIGPTHIPDVFRGQVLSLHPLSAFFMRDPALCAIAGRFFTSSSYDFAMQGGAGLSNEYWNLVGAILTSAHTYRQALDQQARQRGTYVRTANEEAEGAEKDLSATEELTDYAAFQGSQCVSCRSSLRCLSYSPAAPNEAELTAQYSCRSCGRATTQKISHLSFKSFLEPGQDTSPQDPGLGLKVDRPPANPSTP